MSFGNNVYNTVDGNSGTSFSVGLSFGGNSVGITYESQFGYYQRIGNICFFTLFLSITNKGSSTGQARLENLPFFPNGPNICRLAALQRTINLPVNYYNVFVEPSGNFAFLKAGGDNNFVIDLDDTHFTNNSQIICSGFYFV